MQLIDVTNSYARKIRRELMNTPVHFIKVFTLGNSKVVFKRKTMTLKSSFQISFDRLQKRKSNSLKSIFWVKKLSKH